MIHAPISEVREQQQRHRDLRDARLRDADRDEGRREGDAGFERREVIGGAVFQRRSGHARPEHRELHGEADREDQLIGSPTRDREPPEVRRARPPRPSRRATATAIGWRSGGTARSSPAAPAPAQIAANASIVGVNQPAAKVARLAGSAMGAASVLSGRTMKELPNGVDVMRAGLQHGVETSSPAARNDCPATRVIRRSGRVEVQGPITDGTARSAAWSTWSRRFAGAP